MSVFLLSRNTRIKIENRIYARHPRRNVLPKRNLVRKHISNFTRYSCICENEKYRKIREPLFRFLAFVSGYKYTGKFADSVCIGSSQRSSISSGKTRKFHRFLEQLVHCYSRSRPSRLYANPFSRLFPNAARPES